MKTFAEIIAFIFCVLIVSGCNNEEAPREVRAPVKTVEQPPKVAPAPVSSSEAVTEDTAAVESSSSESVSSSSVAVRGTKRPGRFKSPEKDVVKDPCEGTPADMICDSRDGERYKTVQIGNQRWMAENLRYSVDEGWCYENDYENCKSYGRLYTWTAAVGLDVSFQSAFAKDSIGLKHRGVCPEGWHIPSKAEIDVLISFVQDENSKLRDKENVGTSLKSAEGWMECDQEDEECSVGTNRYGFNAKPAGRRNLDGTFDDLFHDAGFWTSEESDNASHAPYWDLYYATDKFWGSYTNRKGVGYSVRCLKD
ncbi:fibrobacter succinogenes major paralogous domain-containing protein [Fibrobacter sp. UBA4309]|uniref:fibrobacter succinogenes major paralogous domain-containing protein n=1 Tax=Fibrobacter sp. UBA4309 TaxID=1946537 RepID=UPI0025C61996|nr:fibrobacter succinogenes major paralogous domain-containing protein [Fibrobacter sp. UBA4309]